MHEFIDRIETGMTHVNSVGIGWRWGRSAQPEDARKICEVGCFH